MTRPACKERRQASSKRRTRNASAASCRANRAWVCQLKSTPRVNLTRTSLAGDGAGMGGGVERKRRLKRRQTLYASLPEASPLFFFPGAYSWDLTGG